MDKPIYGAFELVILQFLSKLRFQRQRSYSRCKFLFSPVTALTTHRLILFKSDKLVSLRHTDPVDQRYSLLLMSALSYLQSLLVCYTSTQCCYSYENTSFGSCKRCVRWRWVRFLTKDLLSVLVSSYLQQTNCFSNNTSCKKFRVATIKRASIFQILNLVPSLICFVFIIIVCQPILNWYDNSGTASFSSSLWYWPQWHRIWICSKS